MTSHSLSLFSHTWSKEEFRVIWQFAQQQRAVETTSDDDDDEWRRRDVMIIISPPSLRSKGREKQRKHIYSTKRTWPISSSSSIVTIPSSDILSSSSFVCVSRQPAKETERDRDREKGICGDEIGIECLLPKEKRVVKKVEIFKAAFSSNGGVVTKF